MRNLPMFAIAGILSAAWSAAVAQQIPASTTPPPADQVVKPTRETAAEAAKVDAARATEAAKANAAKAAEAARSDARKAAEAAKADATQTGNAVKVEANAAKPAAGTSQPTPSATAGAQIMALLAKTVFPTSEQTPQLTSLVGDFAGKFGQAATKNAGLSAVMKQQAQNVLMDQFTKGLGKILKPEQLAKFNGIKNQILPLFTAIR